MSETYKFTHPGIYRFEPRNHFYYVDPTTSAAISITAHVVAAHEALISGRLAIVRQRSTGTQNATTLQKRIENNGCTEDQIAALEAASVAAQSYVSGGVR